MVFAGRILEKLTRAFAPEAIEVVDESRQHQGHAGARPGGETHFRVRLVSAAFEGVSRVERQRAVMRALKAEMDERVHALALKTLTPTEAALEKADAS